MSLNKIAGTVLLTTFVSLFSCSAVFAEEIAKINENNVNVRAGASTQSNIIGTLNTGADVTILSQEGDWFQVSYGDIKSAYIASEYLTMAESETQAAKTPAAVNTYAIVTSENGLKLREEQTTESNALLVLSFNEVVDVIEPGAQWIKVRTDSGAIGYVSSEFVSVRSGEKPSRDNTAKGEQVVAYAKQFIGTPYAWGGTNLSKGVDCSGFVYAVMNHFGVSLNRSSRDMAANGVPVEKSQLIPGDLVLFDTTGVNDGGISHVGIYVGNGQYIHSSSGKVRGVIISDLYDDYGLRTYVTARRVLR